ncbi:hypothetical protein JCM8547_005772 [Rhodosporidiobolus lusitaniae]
MSLGRAFQIGSHGLTIPAVGLGTWKSQPGEVRNAVKVALDAGYKHIDCAWAYGNENEVGQGIKDAGVNREKIWVTSKVFNGNHRPEGVHEALNKTLSDLKVGYLDLYLMHWPVAWKTGPSDGKKPVLDEGFMGDEGILKTWRVLEELVKDGKVKHIGVSNFTRSKTKALLEKATIKPAVNQVELNLHCAQYDLVKWHQESGVLLEAYSPLGSTGAPQLSDPVVVELAKKHKVNPANILISWQVARGCVVLPKSVTPQRIRSNFEDVELSPEDVNKLEKRATEIGTKRTVDPSEGWGVPDLWEDKGFP